MSTFTASRQWSINTDYDLPRVMAQDRNGAYVPLAPFAESTYPDNVTLRRTLCAAAAGNAIGDVLESREARFLNHSWVDLGSVLVIATPRGNLAFFAQPGTDPQEARAVQAKVVRGVGRTFPSVKASRNRRSAVFAVTPVAAAGALIGAVFGAEKLLDR